MQWVILLACEFLVLMERLQTIREFLCKLSATLLLTNITDQTTLSLSHQHGKAKDRGLFMRLHTLLLDLQFTTNAKANVQAVAANAKKKGVCVLLIAILA